MLNILKKKKTKYVQTIVSTLEADLDMIVDGWTKTKRIFDTVAHTIGLRETSFFGLAIIPKSGHPIWLKLDKKLFDQVPSEYIIIEEGKEEHKPPSLHLQFYAKFYPEKIEDELIQDITRHLFFLQFQKLILKGMLSCEPQAALLLASFSIQAKFGDYDLNEPGTLYHMYQHLLPPNVFERYDRREVEDQITTWHMSHQGLCREEAELEYLKIVHDFEMSGISYFKIQDGNGISKWLGVNAKSVALYPSEDKIHPTTRIGWGSLTDMSYSGTKFVMKQSPPSLPTVPENLNRRVREIESSSKEQPQQQATPSTNKSKTNMISDTNGTKNNNFHQNKSLTDLVFMVDDPDVCKLIMDLCRGNHEMYMMRRRVGNTMEIQQMKALAKEDKQRREMEKERVRKEHELQTKMQQDKEEMDDKYKQLELRYNDCIGALQRAEETAELLNEKVRAYEEEGELLRAKAVTRDSEVQNLKSKVEKLQSSQRDLESECENYKDLIEQLNEKLDLKEEENRLLEEKLHGTKQLLHEANYSISCQVNHSSQSSNPAAVTTNHQQQQQHYSNIQQTENQLPSWNNGGQSTSTYGMNNIYNNNNTTPANTQQQYYVHHSASNSFSEQQQQQIEQQQQQQQSQSLIGLSQYEAQYDHTPSYENIASHDHSQNEDTIHSLSLQLQSEQSNIHSKSMAMQQQLQQVNAQMEDYHNSYDDNDVSPSSVSNSQENLFTSE